MKIQILVAFLLVAVVATMAAPNQVAEEKEIDAVEVAALGENGDLERGFTCSIGDWACSAHCRGIGKEGGTCIKGTCTCYD
ncbi:defensin-1-like [Colletes latitarsis]|uniref:defensin-1-like n=1 Tax=Colletes latitarsis TaxID=2605962 RepID=UPI0040370044